MCMEQEVGRNLNRGEIIIYHVEIEELGGAELRLIYEHQVPFIDKAMLRAHEIIREYLEWSHYNQDMVEDWGLKLEALEEFKVELVHRFAVSGPCDKSESSQLTLVPMFNPSGSKSILDIIEEFEAATRVLGSGDGKSAVFIDHCLEPDVGAQFWHYRQLPFKSLKIAMID